MKIKLASVFQNHAVLQRDLPLPVWGHGEPGESVLVRLNAHEAQTQVDAEGNWLLRMPPLQAGGPHRLRVEAESGVVELDDLLAGDVWLCSGQSNMEWKLGDLREEWHGDLADLPQIRMLTVSTGVGHGCANRVEGRWTVCTPSALLAFSAVGGFFGRELHARLGVPIGLICNAWGGTRVQAWMSREALMQDPSGRNEVAFYESFVWKTGGQSVPASISDWKRTSGPHDAGNIGLERGWTGSAFDDSSWPAMRLPGHWNRLGEPFNGVLWFRMQMEIPESWGGRDLELSLGAIDKHDETWVNGELVGATGWENPDSWKTPRVYTVPGRLTDASRLVTIAVRARSHVYDGGFSGPATTMFLRPHGSVEEPLSLAGEWRYFVEQNWGVVIPPDFQWCPDNPNSPHALFDNRLALLIPYGLRGVIWYQGESNAGDAADYARMLTAMIRDWRRRWAQGDFPFLQVQLANFGPAAMDFKRSQWAELREAQAMVLAEPALGMAVAIDIGEALDIHPQNKRDVGLRLARWALSEFYGREGIPSGPLFKGIQIESGGRLRCFFLHVGKGLVSRGGPLTHFLLAGRDRAFHRAEARIDGETVVVRCDAVTEPAAVRYAWADNPEGCNLFNEEGLPASPFRSDSWPV